MEEERDTDAATLRKRTIEDMERMLEAAAALRADLDGHMAVSSAVLEGVRNEQDIGEVLDEVSSRTWRPQMTDSLTTYERLRHRARLRLIALGVAEGMSVADIEYHWSITRQLANRSIREAERLD